MSAPAPTVTDVADGFIRHFYSADQAMGWRSAETELSVELTNDIILAGRIDAIGDDFFGEWKSASTYARNGWREKWRFHPQSLTYGLLLRLHPATAHIKRFTVRMAFKSNPPTFDHEWFEYSDGELATWRDEVLGIARSIQYYKHIDSLPTSSAGHWPLNPLSCYKYGLKYPCAFVHACTHQAWNIPVAGLAPRQPHLDTERELVALFDATRPLVLDATSISKYLECPEDYRRSYVEGGLGYVEPEGEALRFGKDFHSALDAYYKELIHGRNTIITSNSTDDSFAG